MFLLFDKSNPLIFLMCFKRIIVAYLCPNMINFDAEDFSEHRSEEVICFIIMTLSVHTLSVKRIPNVSFHQKQKVAC